MDFLPEGTITIPPGQTIDEVLDRYYAEAGYHKFKHPDVAPVLTGDRPQKRMTAKERRLERLIREHGDKDTDAR